MRRTWLGQKRLSGKRRVLPAMYPLDTLCTGTPDEVKGYCKKLIDTAGRDGGFILSTGAGVQGSKRENIGAMIDLSREYGKYR